MEDIKVYLEVEKETHYDYWKVGGRSHRSEAALLLSNVIY